MYLVRHGVVAIDDTALGVMTDSVSPVMSPTFLIRDGAYYAEKVPLR